MHKLSANIDRLNTFVGKTSSWLMLVMVLVTFFVVLLRYVFNLGWVWLQEIVTYSHAILFLSAAGYGLHKNSHVRVDIFYQKMSVQKKAWVDLLGSLLLLFPFCLVIFFQSFEFVSNSWRELEGSKDGGGLEAVFILKSFILVYSALLLLQGVSVIQKSWEQIKGSRSG